MLCQKTKITITINKMHADGDTCRRQWPLTEYHTDTQEEESCHLVNGW